MQTTKLAKAHVRRWLNNIGWDIHRFSTSEWRWSYDVDDYHPVAPQIRWGHERSPHPEITRAIQEWDDDILSLLARLSEHSAAFADVPLMGDPNNLSPYWRNGWFENFDAVALLGMLLVKRPKIYLEIGSGNSTKFVRYAMQTYGLNGSITSIDPEPRAVVDTLCDRVIRKRLEDVELSLFDSLQSGDMVFFDGSHRVFQNSDVTVFFLDVLPRLRRGVMVHIHDIFLPWDYPLDWQKKMYSEQYILGAMLLCEQYPFKIVLPNFYACNNPRLRLAVEKLTDPISCKPQGWSFWIEKT